MVSRTPEFQQYTFENTLHIAPKAAFELINNDNAVLLDVREDYEIAQGRPALSVNMMTIPLFRFNDEIKFVATR